MGFLKKNWMQILALALCAVLAAALVRQSAEVNVLRQESAVLTARLFYSIIMMVLHCYLLKIRSRMFAERADKVRRQFFALIAISAYSTSPCSLSLGSLGLRLRFDG